MHLKCDMDPPKLTCVICLAIAQPQNATTSCSLHSFALFSLVSPQQLVLVELLLPKFISLAYNLLFQSFVWLRTFSIPAHLCCNLNLIFRATSLLSVFPSACSMYLSVSLCLFNIISLLTTQNNIYMHHTPLSGPWSPICHLEPAHSKVE